MATPELGIRHDSVRISFRNVILKILLYIQMIRMQIIGVLKICGSRKTHLSFEIYYGIKKMKNVTV